MTTEPKYMLALTMPEMATLVMCVGASSGMAMAQPEIWEDMAAQAKLLGLGLPLHKAAELAAFCWRLVGLAAAQDRAEAAAVLGRTN